MPNSNNNENVVFDNLTPDEELKMLKFLADSVNDPTAYVVFDNPIHLEKIDNLGDKPILRISRK
jgi:hypothetical protein